MQPSKEEIIIRRGTANDIKSLYSLVEENAIHHNLEPSAVQLNATQMLIDFTGERPSFLFFVAETEEKIVGAAIYYYTYSTFKGKSLYLEDLIITKVYRSKSIGKLLMQVLAEEAVQNDSQKMKWQVAEFNERAIKFYENKMDAELDNDWINCELNRTQLEEIGEDILEEETVLA